MHLLMISLWNFLSISKLSGIAIVEILPGDIGIKHGDFSKQLSNLEVSFKSFSLDTIRYNFSIQVVNTTNWFFVIDNYIRFHDVCLVWRCFFLVSVRLSLWFLESIVTILTLGFVRFTPADGNKLSVAKVFL